MSLFGSGKKKEEVKVEPACACNGKATAHEASSCCCKNQQEENICDKDNKITSIKVLGAGCKSCHKQFENVKKAVEELGLEIVQESMMDKQLSKIDFDKEINDIVNFLKLDGRNFITTREINGNKNWSSYWTLERMCKKYYSIG